jgi:hypothetical protein
MNTSPSSSDANAPWLHPSLTCDAVMKGGITSGIVYPGAISELAKRYTFRSIGGASAGAIAAAATAAAEYGRRTPNGGFARINDVPGELGTTDSGESRLLQLFVPERSTKRLFTAALGFVRYGKARALAGLAVAFPRFPMLAAAVAIVAAALALADVVSWTFAVIVIAFTPWILVLGVLWDAYTAFRRVADNDFGLCKLGPRSSDPNAKPLTLWLYELLQDIGGRPHGRPLTFADLWGVELPDKPDDLSAEQREALTRRGWDASARRIDLQVMTTNLTNGRPMRIPAGRDRHEGRADDGGGLLFDPDEWAEFFPKPVMDHLVAYSRVPSGERGDLLARLAKDNKLRYLPDGYALPIVVAARLSLSFPVLISVVPLWYIRDRRRAPAQLRRVLFSDGGISSNFPVHFFDTPLPRRPTFAINLAGFEAEEKPVKDDPSVSVVEPVPATGRAVETWKEIDSMFGLFISIKDAMQNWRDNSQARLPGFRERVIHVKLADGEGGLNLAMEKDKIVELNDRGRYAGTRLVELFSGAPADQPPVLTESWDHHRWARLRVSLSALERLLRSFAVGYTELEPGDEVTPRYETRIQRGTVKPYKFQSDAQQTFAIDTVQAYRELVDGWGNEQTLDDADRPHPVPALRLVPPV